MPYLSTFRLLVSLLLLLRSCTAVLDFETDFGATADDSSPDVCWQNTRLLNDVFRRNLSQHQTLRIVGRNRTLHFYPGIVARQLQNVHLIVDGTMRFWRPENTSDSAYLASMEETTLKEPVACWLLADSTNVTVSTTIALNETATTSPRGLIDGQGSQYWGIPYIGYLETRDHLPPRLFQVQKSSQILVQRLSLQDCPKECLALHHVNHMFVRNSSIVSRRTTRHSHGFVDMSAFDTKGITMNASNHVTLNAVDIWTQDECVSVNDGSANVKLQGINASGLGFAITCSGGSVRNVSIHNSRLYRSMKGLYLTFHRGKTGNASNRAVIENVHVENLTMESTTMWPLWFGPAQQAATDDACAANPCSLCWPQTPGTSCNAVPQTTIRNITLRNVQINNPRITGVLLSDGATAAIDTVVFENVRVTKGEPLAYATKDLTRTFQGLHLPVHDAFISNDGKLRKDLAAKLTFSPLNELEDYHGYELPSQEFLGMNVVARIGIIVGTCLCALSLAILVAWCIRMQCIDGNSSMDDDSVLQPPEEPLRMQTGLLDGTDLGRQGGSAEDVYQATVSTSLDSDVHVSFEEPLLPRTDASSPLATRRSRVSRSCQVAPYHVIALLAAIYGLLVGLSWLIELPGKAEWEKLNRYFVCEGVTNGVARGSTWPVPYCFVDETERFSFTQIYDQLSSVLRSHFVLAACLLTCFSLYIHFSFLFKQRTARNALASIGNDSVI